MAVLAVAGSLVAVRSEVVERLDHWAGQRLARPRGHVVDRLVGVATDLGSVYGLSGVCSALAATGRRRAATDLALAGGVAWCVAQGAKPLVRRPRPYQGQGATRLVAEPAGSSWPSGHTAVAAAMATTLAPRLSPGVRAVVGAAATGVACSRLYVGVHHPSDVAAGAGIGVLSARLADARWARRAGGRRASPRREG